MRLSVSALPKSRVQRAAHSTSWARMSAWPASHPWPVLSAFLLPSALGVSLALPSQVPEGGGGGVVLIFARCAARLL